MYTAAAFDRFSNPEKWAVLEDDGTYLDVYRMQGEIKICLFSLADYYVEVFYHPKQDRLLRASALSAYEGLDPYLSQISITSIYATL